jgi:flagellar biosynthesis protein FlhA
MLKGMRKDLALAGGVLMIIAVMILPIPPIMLDLLLALNISLSLTMLLTALYVAKPTDYSMFPSLLLLTTMFRLSINVASTRLILLNGADGTDAAGRIIQSFGQFVVGGNYVVGLTIFVILVIINFMVITKGSGRIAEVAARFTLDAMPGKQMAIDADLNAGLLSEDSARERRSSVESEANFYGAMDGASKFVRGDAIAGILITAINIVGGFLIGVAQEGMGAAEAAQVYTILTVGDGLVSQIPSLIISSAAGIVVTRAASTGIGFGSGMLSQLMSSQKTYIALSVSLVGVGLIPGMPGIIFWVLAAGSAAVAWWWPRVQEAIAEPEVDLDAGSADSPEAPDEQAELKEMLPLNLLELTIGYQLVALVDEQSGGDLLDRIGGLRRSLANELGFILPAVHIKDDLTLQPAEYRLLLKGELIGQGELFPNKLLAIDPGVVHADIDGIPTHEPAFGLPALWIDEGSRDEAELAGYTVVEPSAVLATHLAELLRQYGHELLGRQEVQELLDVFGETNAKVIEELIPQHLTVGDVVQVLRQLLQEQISVRDLRTVLEILADHAPHTKDPALLTEFVRQGLGRSITRKYSDDEGVLHVLTLDQTTEDLFRRGRTESGMPALDPGIAQSLLSNIETSFSDASGGDVVPVLLTAPDLRRQLRTFIERFIPSLAVLSYKEVDPRAEIRAVGAIRI